MKIGIISDTHDQLDRIHDALKVFQGEKVDAVIHCGDFVAPFAVKLFQRLHSPFYAVFGNNDGEKQGLQQAIKGFGGEIFTPPHMYIMGKKRITVYHDLPPQWKKRGEASPPPDYVIYGHTHQSDFTRDGRTVIINPGEACGWLTGKALVGLLDLASGEYVSISLLNHVAHKPASWKGMGS